MRGRTQTARADETTYLSWRPATYYLAAPPTSAWPGQVYLASVSSEAGALGVRPQSSAAELLGTSWPEGADSEQAAFLCPPGETCRLSVQPGEGYGGEALPFTLDAGEAELRSEEDLFVAMPMQDLAMWEKSAVIVTPAGIGVLDGSTRQWQAALIGDGVAAGQALSPCGGYLYLARLGARGLTVLDLSDPGNPAVRTRAFTAGLGWDVAASGGRVYIAHGIFGVGIYSISDRGEVSYQDSLIPGGLVRSVAADRRLLAAARRDGRIQLYSLEGGVSPAGQVRAAGQISRIRLVAGKLWVLSMNEARLEIFDLTDLTAPARIGDVTANAAEIFRRRFAGPLAFSYSGHWLRIRRAVRVTP